MNKKVQSPASSKTGEKKSMTYRGRNSEEDFGKNKDVFNSYNEYNKNIFNKKEKTDLNYGSRFRVKEKDTEQELEKTSKFGKEKRIDRYGKI